MGDWTRRRRRSRPDRTAGARRARAGARGRRGAGRGTATRPAVRAPERVTCPAHPTAPPAAARTLAIFRLCCGRAAGRRSRCGPPARRRFQFHPTARTARSLSQCRGDGAPPSTSLSVQASSLAFLPGSASSTSLIVEARMVSPSSRLFRAGHTPSVPRRHILPRARFHPSSDRPSTRHPSKHATGVYKSYSARLASGRSRSAVSTYQSTHRVDIGQH